MQLARFRLPPKGSLVENSENDPLRYYYAPVVGWLFVHRLNIVLQLLENRTYGKTLEIGYGSGILMPTLCKVSDQVYGVDLNSDPDEVLPKLKQLGCSPILSRGIEDQLLFEDNSLDLVVAVSVLEHIATIDEFLAEIHRVLKPGGQLLVGMPAVNKTMEYLFQAIGFGNIDHHHVTTPETMERSAKKIFRRVKGTAWMPGFFPSNIYLYKSFCFEK